MTVSEGLVFRGITAETIERARSWDDVRRAHDEALATGSWEASCEVLRLVCVHRLEQELRERAGSPVLPGLTI